MSETGEDANLETDLEPVLSAFAQAYIRRIPDEHVSQRPDEEVFAELRTVFDFAVGREVGEIAVRVYNPTLEDDGYDPLKTVVDIVVDDSRFLVDSVRAAIEAEGHSVTLDAHFVIGWIRDDEGRVVDVGHVRTGDYRDSVQHYTLERTLDSEERASLKAALESVLADVDAVVSSFESLRDGAIDRMIELVRLGSSRYGEAEVSEGVELMRWLRDDNFVFLGYREYSIVEDNGEAYLVVEPGSGLGILSDTTESSAAEPVPMASLPADLQQRYAEGFLVVVAKTNRISTVHRPARMDYVGVRIMSPEGEVVGEARLIGLFTSRALMSESATMPILRGKLQAVIDAEDLYEGSHDYRAVVQAFNSFPKAELWSMPIESLRSAIQGLLTIERKEQTRLFVSPDLLARSVTVLVVLPRDRFNATLRRQLQDMFLERYGGTSADYQLTLGEEGAARLHFTVWVDGPVPEVPFDELQQTVVSMSRTWADRVAELLDTMVDRGADLAHRWADRLPEYYRTSTSLAISTGDILQLEVLASSDQRLIVGLQNEEPGEDGLSRVAVYCKDGKLELSHILPALEALGLRVVEEVPTRVDGEDSELFIHDIGVLGPHGHQLDLERCGERLIAAIEAGLRGEIDPDSLDRLIVLTELTHSQVRILRAYRTYRQRVSTGFTLSYVNDTLAAHPDIAEQLVGLFEARFEPDDDHVATDVIEGEIFKALDEVASLDEDRILRGFLQLIMATVRTNAYKPDAESLSFKLWSAAVPGMPEPKPLYEIFVYAPHVEGIHLRGGMVARGGLRWSDRREDYRAEVLGLMKAQMTKNAVIVPTGAKGGFVLRGSSKDAPNIREAVTAAYKTFVRGLLDVTDNLVSGEIMPPPHVRRHDGDDPYLVVAADRGTAAMSDTANGISAEYGFWMRDAFASGGSNGYDHKKLGITARGGWESVKQHFIDMSIDVDDYPMTAVGIGDMSGDVFGNGMLRSPNLRLVAAFDHRDIFIDPDPDGPRGFDERSRLFSLAQSSWQDYDRSLISPGGGVWSRSEKSIDLSDEVRSALQVEDEALTPDDLIKAILRAPVDLLWNGGIGTYVRASWESDADCADRSNDALRVSAPELRCFVVGEGGNLGFTQAGRIQYAANGGRINTDFIDNSGGVDCSDREVNLKILLGVAEERGELTAEERPDVILEATEGVVERVLHGNFEQAQTLSQDEEWSVSNLEAYEDLMKTLERHDLLNRELEGLPSSDDLAERARNGKGLTRPELSVLLAYAKQDLTNALIGSDVPDMDEVASDLASYFPSVITERFGHLLDAHPLRREILATVLANRVLNDEGITFVNRLVMETGATRAEVVPAYRLAHTLIGADDRWAAVEGVGADVEPALRREMLDAIDWLVESITRWFLAQPGGLPSADEMKAARIAFSKLESCFADPEFVELREERGSQIADLVEAGVPVEAATRHAYHDELVHAPDIIDLAHRSGRDVSYVAELFILVGYRYRLDWLEQQVAELGATTRWNRWAIRSLEGDLVRLRKDISGWVLDTTDDSDPESALTAYAEARAERHARLEQFMHLLGQEGSADLDPLLVAVQQIRALAG